VFAAGVNRKNMAPHDIFATRVPHTDYLLVREPDRSSLREFTESLSAMFEHVSS